MAYEIEWHTWEEEVYIKDEGPRIHKVRLAEITADTMDDLGIAVDEVEKKWGPGAGRLTHHEKISDSLARMKETGVMNTKMGLPKRHDNRVTPTREGGRWHILWGFSSSWWNN